MNDVSLRLDDSVLLLLVAMALLAGRKSLASIQRYGQFLTQKQRATLGWPSNKAGTFRQLCS